MSLRLRALSRERGRLRSTSYRPRLEWMEERTLLSDVSWTGNAHDNNWDTPGNWSTDSVPGSGDDVTINIAANVVHSSSVTDSINSLTSTEPLTISGGSLSIAAASTIGGALTISGGTLTGTGDVTVSGLATLSSGTISGSGAVNANGGILFNVANAIFTLDGRTLTNPAGQTATWTGINSDIALSDGAVFDNLGVFQDQCTAGHEFVNTAGAAASFNDDGSFIKSASSSQGYFLQGVSFNVTSGSLDVQTGTLELLGGGTDTDATSAFTIESGTSLESATRPRLHSIAVRP